MARKRDTRPFGKIYYDVWEDPDFTSLTIEAQAVYFMLISSRQRNHVGVTDYAPGRFIGNAANWTPEKFRYAIAELEAAHYVVVDHDSMEVLIRTYNRHDKTLNSPNMGTSVGRVFRTVFSPKLRERIVQELAKYYRLEPDVPGWEKLSLENPELWEAIATGLRPAAVATDDAF